MTGVIKIGTNCVCFFTRSFSPKDQFANSLGLLHAHYPAYFWFTVYITVLRCCGDVGLARGRASDLYKAAAAKISLLGTWRDLD